MSYKRPLGKTQKAVLQVLAQPGRNGEWFGGCGWVWDTYSGTVRIMNSLAKRGLVSVSTRQGLSARPFTIWTITDDGREAAKLK